MTLDTKQPKTIISKGWETNEVSPMMAPVYSLRGYVGYAAGTENAVRAWRTP